MDNLRYAGDVRVESVLLTSLTTNRRIEIKNQIIGINVYEDIFSPFISGSLTIKDSVDLPNALPLVGNEIVRLKITTPSLESFSIDVDFYVYKMTDRMYDSDRSVIYSLHFISIEAIKDINLKISRSFSGNISTIATDILTKDYGLNTTKKILREETSNIIKFISNFWRPVRIIDFLCSRAISKTNNSSYIFYENRDGFNFRSIENLYSEPSIQDFNYNNSSRELLSSAYRNIENEFSKIIELTIPKSFDILSDTESGRYASRMYSYDITTKQYTLKFYDYYEDFSKSINLNKNPAIPLNLSRRSSSRHFESIDHYEIFDGFKNSTSGDIDSQKRNSLLLNFESNKVNITVNGRLDYTVGRKVYLKLYKVEPIRDEDTNDTLIDEINSGFYIISAINHSISRLENKHTCYIEMVKDTYIKDLNNDK